MRPIRFHRSSVRGVHVWRYEPDESTSWVDDFHQPETVEGEPYPFREFAVNNTNRAEVVVYTSLAWHLTNNLHRLVIPRYFRDEVAQELQQTPTLVDWEYAVDLESGETTHGFVQGRACVTHWFEPGHPETEHPDMAGLFTIGTFHGLTSALRGTLRDASSQIGLFGVQPEPRRNEALVRSLRSTTRPELDDVLRPGEVFVNIGIGVDMGYRDVLTVASVDDVGDELERLCAGAHERILSFEASEHSTMREYLTALGELSGVEPWRGWGPGPVGRF